jgi:exopolysaccharide production protein ExoY
MNDSLLSHPEATEAKMGKRLYVDCGRTEETRGIDPQVEEPGKAAARIDTSIGERNRLDYRFVGIELHDKADIRPLGGKLKRIFDFIFTLFFFVLALPVFVGVAAALKLADRGPLIFKHTRVGLGGRRFSCFKFRTMIVGAEKALNSLLDADADARAQWERCQKLAYDPRITPVGRFLRRQSIDELPQLINVLRGEMSLVGPRPITPSEMSRYGANLGLYLSARPGVTGPWQISGRSDCDFDRRVKLDADYVSSWRFSNDLFILLQTIRAVLSRKGSY